MGARRPWDWEKLTVETMCGTKIATAVILVTLGMSLAGCVANRPPVVELEVWPLQGDIPLQVYLNRTFYDFDGDALETRLWTEPNGFWLNGSKPAGPPVFEATPSWQWFLRPGNYTVHFQVTDGTHVVSTSKTIRVTSDYPYLTIFRAEGKTAEPCGPCSVALLQEIEPLGANACKGFITGVNGTDCIWYPLQLGWEGRSFNADALGADVDLEFRTGCTTDSRKLAQFSSHGVERGEIPAGSECVVLWTYDKPATVFFDIQPEVW